MPGFLLHVGAQVLCAHAGQATPTTPNPRVTVSGQSTVLITTPYVVAGCTLPTLRRWSSPRCKMPTLRLPAISSRSAVFRAEAWAQASLLPSHPRRHGTKPMRKIDAR